MKRSAAIFLLALISGLLVPALCMGGVLEHACDCVFESCDHEEDCPDDPCQRYVQVEPAARGFLELPLRALPTQASAPFDFPSREAASPLRWRSIRASSLHSSDIPLRR